MDPNLELVDWIKWLKTIGAVDGAYNYPKQGTMFKYSPTRILLSLEFNKIKKRESSMMMNCIC